MNNRKQYSREVNRYENDFDKDFNKNLKNNRAKALARERGWIVRIVEKMFPYPLDQDMIRQQLVELNFLTSESEIRAHIAYLEQKEIVAVSDIGEGYIKRTVVALTAYGKDVFDGTVPAVPGVDIG
jgi:hypothetical protein